MREQKVKNAYDKNSELYNKALGGKAWWSSLFQRMAWGIDLADKDLERTVVDCLPDDFRGKLLDVPVGTGLFTKDKYAKMANAQIVCLDYSQGMLDRAREAFDAVDANAELRQGDVAALPYEDGEFDALLTMNGLPCFPDKEKSLKEMLRVLKIGGSLIGCSYVKGARVLSDLIVGKIYSWIGYTTPPYQTAAELTRQLKRHFATVKTRQLGALLVFKCSGKTVPLKRKTAR